MKQSPTINDIASEAGVSKSTVSLVLNGSDKVAPKTAERVLSIVEKRKYRPNAFAKRLSKGKSEIISLFMLTRRGSPADWILQSSWTIYNPIFRGISLVLSKKKYQFQIEFIDIENQDYQAIITNTILEGRTDGVMLLVTNQIKSSFLNDLLEYDTPVIILNEKIIPAISSVEINNYKGAYDSVNYLIGLGHRNIAHITGPKDSFNAQKRLKGYINALEHNGIKIDEKAILEGNWKIESGQHNMSKLVKLKNSPTAVFCANDHMALGAMQTINEIGLSVPKDISLIGYDNTEISTIVKPNLTTVHIPLDELGRIASEELMSAVEDPDDAVVQHVVLNPLLLKRDSCLARAGLDHNQ